MYEKLVRIIIFVAIIGIIGCSAPGNGTKWSKQGKEYYSKRQYEKAKEYFHKALGKDHPYTKTTKKSLSIAQEKLASGGQGGRFFQKEPPLAAGGY